MRRLGRRALTFEHCGFELGDAVAARRERAFELVSLGVRSRDRTFELRHPLADALELGGRGVELVIACHYGLLEVGRAREHRHELRLGPIHLGVHALGARFGVDPTFNYLILGGLGQRRLRPGFARIRRTGNLGRRGELDRAGDPGDRSRGEVRLEPDLVDFVDPGLRRSDLGLALRRRGSHRRRSRDRGQRRELGSREFGGGRRCGPDVRYDLGDVEVLHDVIRHRRLDRSLRNEWFCGRRLCDGCFRNDRFRNRFRDGRLRDDWFRDTRFRSRRFGNERLRRDGRYRLCRRWLGWCG